MKKVNRMVENEKLHRSAEEQWGFESQADIWIEEMAELTQALLKMRRKLNNTTVEAVRLEIADVMLCIEQARTLMNENDVRDFYNKALHRYRRLVEDGVDIRKLPHPEEVPETATQSFDINTAFWHAHNRFIERTRLAKNLKQKRQLYQIYCTHFFEEMMTELGFDVTEWRK